MNVTASCCYCYYYCCGKITLLLLLLLPFRFPFFSSSSSSSSSITASIKLRCISYDLYTILVCPGLIAVLVRTNTLVEENPNSTHPHRIVCRGVHLLLVVNIVGIPILVLCHGGSRWGCVAWFKVVWRIATTRL